MSKKGLKIAQEEEAMKPKERDEPLPARQNNKLTLSDRTWTADRKSKSEKNSSRSK